MAKLTQRLGLSLHSKQVTPIGLASSFMYPAFDRKLNSIFQILVHQLLLVLTVSSNTLEMVSSQADLINQILAKAPPEPATLRDRNELMLI